MTYKHADAKAKHSVDVDGVYNMQLHVKSTYSECIVVYTHTDIKNLLYISSHQNNALKLNTSEKTLSFYRIFAHRCYSSKWSENFVY